MQHYAVIGFPVAHSRSPEIYAQLFEKYGVEADFSRISLAPCEIPLLRSVTSGLSGFAVTMPHKRAVIEHLDSISETARACGAVNIVERRGNELLGHNTDGDGMADALAEAGVQLSGQRVFILGRGGAAVSAAHAVKQRGGEPFFLVRSFGPDRGFPELLFDEAALAGERCGVFINASPLGMAGLVDFDSFRFLDLLSPSAVLDMVYLNGTKTRLVSEAASRGMTTADGSRMLLMQALRAFRIWTGIEASPSDVIL